MVVAKAVNVDKPLPRMRRWDRLVPSPLSWDNAQHEELLRRRIAVEEVRCASIDDSHRHVATFSFIVRTRQVFRGGVMAEMQANSESSPSSGSPGSPSKPQPTKHDRRIVVKTHDEILELCKQLYVSFDTLLDPSRGGPSILTKEALLLERSNLWKSLQRNTKRYVSKKSSMNGLGTFSSTETAQNMAMSKTDLLTQTRIEERKRLLDDFFGRLLETGGDIISSSRALQDFFVAQPTKSFCLPPIDVERANRSRHKAFAKLPNGTSKTTPEKRREPTEQIVQSGPAEISRFDPSAVMVPIFPPESPEEDGASQLPSAPATAPPGKPFKLKVSLGEGWSRETVGIDLLQISLNNDAVRTPKSSRQEMRGTDVPRVILKPGPKVPKARVATAEIQAGPSPPAPISKMSIPATANPPVLLPKASIKSIASARAEKSSGLPEHKAWRDMSAHISNLRSASEPNLLVPNELEAPALRVAMKQSTPPSAALFAAAKAKETVRPQTQYVWDDALAMQSTMIPLSTSQSMLPDLSVETHLGEAYPSVDSFCDGHRQSDESRRDAKENLSDSIADTMDEDEDEEGEAEDDSGGNDNNDKGGSTVQGGPSLEPSSASDYGISGEVSMSQVTTAQLRTPHNRPDAPETIEADVSEEDGKVWNHRTSSKDTMSTQYTAEARARKSGSKMYLDVNPKNSSDAAAAKGKAEPESIATTSAAPAREAPVPPPPAEKDLPRTLSVSSAADHSFRQELPAEVPISPSTYEARYGIENDLPLPPKTPNNGLSTPSRSNLIENFSSRNSSQQSLNPFIQNGHADFNSWLAWAEEGQARSVGPETNGTLSNKRASPLFCLPSTTANRTNGRNVCDEVNAV